ncbi:hypothetical protein niasHS_007095 [Heterodera schachtii]|uniref:RING-type domain-containing protein n=1 Tax=Heterodera schachtii TaxID=97005 RepID=A0ABD2JFH3_HETSC
MLTLKGRKSLFSLLFLSFSYYVLVNGAGDGGQKSDMTELIREQGIAEKEFDQLVEEVGENERLIEKVFEDEANQTENRSNQMNSEMLGEKKEKGKDFEEKYRIIQAIKEKDTVMSQIIEALRLFIKEIKTGKPSKKAIKEYLQFVIQILALRLRISTEKILPLKNMNKMQIIIELLKIFIQENKANKKETKMRQSIDKKGRNAEKTANKTKANLQQMLQLLGTVIDQIDDTEQLADVCFVGNQKRRTKRCLIDIIILLFNVIDWIIKLIFSAVILVVSVPILVVAGFVDVVKVSVAVVNSSRHLHRSDPIVPPASQTRPAIPPIQIAVKPFNGLPQRIVKDGEQPAESCAICLGNYEQGESVITLPCAEGKHEFHAECFKAWFKQNNSCPLCREKIHVVPAKKGRKSNTSNAVPVF